VPLLAGATLRERVMACGGALVGISLTGLICALVVNHGAQPILIVAPMGASAVLLFAVPASPMAQPWPIIGGNSISAAVGLATAHWIHDPALAIGVAVSIAILAMSLTRCLHPPGGAAALTAVLGGPVVAAAGLTFPLVPVGLDSVLLVAAGFAFHRLTGRAYPHRAAPPVASGHGTRDVPAPLRIGFQPEDLDAALRSEHETFDIAHADLARLLHRIELAAATRTTGALRCADLMARELITVSPADDVAIARGLLVAHDLATLPVVDLDGRSVGVVGFRELEGAHGPVVGCAAPAATAGVGDAVLSLVPMLTSGARAVVIVDGERRVRGVISQADLLAALVTALALATRPAHD
jgi:CBS domain-containing membrane protein